jgi:hypothetical protein
MVNIGVLITVSDGEPTTATITINNNSPHREMVYGGSTIEEAKRAADALHRAIVFADAIEMRDALT